MSEYSLKNEVSCEIRDKEMRTGTGSSQDQVLNFQSFVADGCTFKAETETRQRVGRTGVGKVALL